MGLNRHLEWDQRSDGLAPDYECLSICIAKMGCRSEAALILIAWPLSFLIRGCVAMRVSHISVILSKAKDLVFSATYEDEILRLRLRMTVATQSLPEEEKSGSPQAKIRSIILTLRFHW
jgi:hypothetical protein